MRTVLKYLFRTILALFVLLILAGLWKREQITRLLAVNSLFSEEKIVGNFSNMDSAFLTRSMSRGDGSVAPLPAGGNWSPDETVNTWIKDRAVTGLVVLKDGQLRHESYYLGTGPDDRRISWSMAKSYLSALVGIMLEQGAIASLDDPVETYAPELRGSAYAGASVRNVLNMASGVVFNEDYLDFNSDINRMGRVLALGRSMDQFAAGLQDSFAPAGETWQYVSIDTHVIGMVVRGATGRSIPDLLQEHVIAPMGLEADPYYLTDGYGVAFVLGGLNLTTRDYARFGEMFRQDGVWNGQQIVPTDWIAASTRPSAPTANGNEQYGYQWWMAPDATEGEYYARGIYGQYIYIDKARGVVIALNSADRGFRGDGVNDNNIAIFRRIAAEVEAR
ncbi:CubicO group peptidase, beta-lactamase class C family [Aliiroseovarius halocynthiae]|uniref:Serine hydrolase n=1 Tax=Aliiroseovarius halocynthiae TaxID=985055 RepID=A0A545SYJ8_9RHOB|nr:serine hydrolase [Aliiroseovarius halocynthiae]TQV70009.1 serine hydrolase [Aliiroseovarius halocynthiae]SMR70677.1 CubicO group peptidase, beta-lactamase class C family [Aliiroseovarius halocynthiae]